MDVRSTGTGDGAGCARAPGLVIAEFQSMTRLMLLVLALAACRTGSTPDPEPRKATRERAPARPVLSKELRALAAAVEPLAGAGEAGSGGAKGALRALEPVLRAYPQSVFGAHKAVVAAIEGDAEDTERAMRAVLTMLLEFERPRLELEYQQAMVALDDLVSYETKDPDPPRPTHVGDALRLMTAAFYLNDGFKPPFPIAEIAAASAAHRPRPRADLEDVTAAIERFKTGGWTERRMAGADALLAMSSVLQQAGIKDTKNLPLTRLRFSAARLRRIDSLQFGASQWIRDGLRAALEALGPAKDHESAQKAVLAIDPQTSLPIQRATIETALIQTRDAFARGARVSRSEEPNRD